MHTGAAPLPEWAATLQPLQGNQALARKHALFGHSTATAPPPAAQQGVDFRPQYPSIQAPEAPDLDLLGRPLQNIPLPPQVRRCELRTASQDPRYTHALHTTVTALQ